MAWGRLRRLNDKDCCVSNYVKWHNLIYVLTPHDSASFTWWKLYSSADFFLNHFAHKAIFLIKKTIKINFKFFFVTQFTNKILFSWIENKNNNFSTANEIVKWIESNNDIWRLIHLLWRLSQIHILWLCVTCYVFVCLLSQQGKNKCSRILCFFLALFCF